MKRSYQILLFIILLPVLIFFHVKGLTPIQEGYILNASEKINSGLTPYNDFSFIYTPGSIILTNLFFQTVGVSILSARLEMLLISLLSVFLIYKIVFYSTRNKLYAAIALLLFIAWGPSHINFPQPTLIALTVGLISLLLLIKFLDTRKIFFLYIAGLFAFEVFFFHQGIGLLMFFTSFIFFAVKNARHVKFIIPFATGYLWGIIFFIIYLLVNGNFGQFFYNIFTIKPALFSTTYEVYFLPYILKTIALAVSFAAFFILFLRRRFHLLFLAFFIGLSFNLSLIGIPLALFLRYNVKSSLRLGSFLFAIVLILIGIKTADYRAFQFYESPRANVFLNTNLARELSDMQEELDRYTKRHDYVYIDSPDTGYYFVTQRTEPTRSSLIGSPSYKDYYRNALSELVAKEIKVVALKHNSLSNISIKNYIKTHYKFIKKTGQFDLYVRNS